MVAASELSISQDASDLQMAQEIFGDGVTIVSADYSGDNWSSGIYTGGDSTSPGVVPGDSGIILSTGRASNFTNSNGNANQSTNTSSDMRWGIDNDPDFNAAAGTNTYDASFLDVTFIPDTNLMAMQFVFSSEEYPEFIDSVYQDFIGVWVNGVQVDLTVGNGDVDPGNLNTTNNENLFVNNSNSDYNTEMDGFTITLTLTMVVDPGVENTIRIGVADVSDSKYDSNLLIAGDSIQSDLVALADSSTMFATSSSTLDVLSNDISSGGVLTITHINGQPVVAGDTVLLNTGQTIQLNADGTIEIIGNGDIENYSFTYTVSNGSNSDTGYVTVDSVPCFVAGTRIETPDGFMAVEDILPGHLVMTRDEGPQPVRWSGRHQVEALGDLAPIHIRAGTFGQHGDLLVSPQHRVLMRDSLAELLFGEGEVLVAAKDLLNDHSVTRRCGDQVTYVHLMFDQHQIIFSEGLETESFFLGPQTANCLEQPIVDEICKVFPELDPATGQGYGPSARRTLRKFEAQLLLQNAQAT